MKLSRRIKDETETGGMFPVRDAITTEFDNLARFEFVPNKNIIQAFTVYYQIRTDITDAKTSLSIGDQIECWITGYLAATPKLVDYTLGSVLKGSI